MRDDDTLLEMQRLDHDELLDFLDRLRLTVRRALELQPNVGSEVVLELKEDLDRLYEMSAGLAEDQSANQAAIAQLLEVIMCNVERGAAGDLKALDELAQEREARAVHFQLLEHPLVADLLHPQSTIGAAELAPSLLSERPDSLAVALQLFDLEQLAQLYVDAQRCLAASEMFGPAADQRLQEIAAYLAELRR